jgi:hypothetical protein
MLISRGRICQRASTDRSTSDTVDDRSPTMATRLVEAVGWITAGGVPTFGSAFACVMRSWTICRASYRSVPGWKRRSMADSPGIERDVIESTHGTPLRRSCSIGTVISCSTSCADRPRASACTWT